MIHRLSEYKMKEKLSCVWEIVKISGMGMIYE